MKVETQLSVFMENKPGRLASMCRVLADMNVNIQSMTVHDTVDHAIVRLIVENPTKALILLEEHGVYIITAKILVVNIDNEPGAIADIARRLAMADENIEYAYCTSTRNQSTGLFVIKTKDPEQTMTVLEES